MFEKDVDGDKMQTSKSFDLFVFCFLLTDFGKAPPPF